MIPSIENPLGDYVAVYISRALKRKFRKLPTAGGGAVTAILCFLLKRKVVDGVIVSRRLKGLQGEVFIATTEEEVMEAAGNRWSVVPLTSEIRESLLGTELRRVAIVGLPCQMQFFACMKALPVLEADFGDRIKLLVSLFCLGTFAQKPFLEFLNRKHGILPEYISSIRLSGEELVICHHKGEIKLRLSDILPYLQAGCLACPDYTGVYADISAGISESYPGYTVLIARTPEADQILKDASSQGFIDLKNAPPDLLREIESRARSKIVRSRTYLPRYA